MKIAKIIFLSLLVYFLMFYNSVLNGYFPSRESKIKTYTDTQIKQFEEDVKENKEIDIEKYFSYENVIETKGLRIGLRTSQFIEKYTKKGAEKVFKMLNNFIDK